MKLPDELRQAYQKNARQFSWVFPLETEQTALAIFAAGEKAYQGERFFWQTPKKDFALVGFGYETILKGAETETHQLNNFLKKSRQLVFKICLFLVRGPFCLAVCLLIQNKRLLRPGES